LAAWTTAENERERRFRALFEAELGFVYRVLRRRGVTERDLPDACQETFLVVHRKLDGWRGEGTLRSWLYGIAVKVAAGQRRRAHVRRELLDDALPERAAPGALVESAEQRETLRLVEAALAELTEDRREVFALYELEGLTMREVADALAISENTAFSRLYGARDEVRAYVTRAERGGLPRAGGGR